MIKNTFRNAKEGILSAYKDNAAVFEGSRAKRFFADPESNEYGGDRRGHRHPLQSGDPQSPNRHFAISRSAA